MPTESADAAGVAGEPDWTSGLDAAAQELVETKGWRSPADVIAGYRDAERQAGPPEPPDGDAPPETEEPPDDPAIAEADVLARREAAAGALRREWGGAYEDNLAFATRAALAFGGEALVAALDDAGLGDEPVVLRALAAIGRATAEHRGIGRGGGFDGPSPGAAKAELRALYADPAFTADLSDKARPGHDAAYDRWSRLVDATGRGG